MLPRFYYTRSKLKNPFVLSNINLMQKKGNTWKRKAKLRERVERKMSTSRFSRSSRAEACEANGRKEINVRLVETVASALVWRCLPTISFSSSGFHLSARPEEACAFVTGSLEDSRAQFISSNFN